MLHQRSEEGVRRRRHGTRSGRVLLCRSLSLSLASARGSSSARIGACLRWLASLAALAGLSIAVDADRSCRSVAFGDSPNAGQVDHSSRSVTPLPVTDEQAARSVQWLASVALNKLPRTFDGDKDWGETKRIWSGVDVKRDGWKLRTHRRHRNVEHGRWIRYEITVPEPGTVAAPQVVIRQVASVADTPGGQPKWRIDSSVVVPMTFTARIQRWNLGVRLYSVTVSGEMRLRLSTSATMGFIADYSEVPPALVIDPKVDQAHLDLERFEVDRVSRLGGDVAEPWGEVVQELFVDRFVRKENDRLVAKLNRSIDKERDDLRFSLSEWFRTWSD